MPTSPNKPEKLPNTPEKPPPIIAKQTSQQPPEKIVDMTPVQFSQPSDRLEPVSLPTKPRAGIPLSAVPTLAENYTAVSPSQPQSTPVVPKTEPDTATPTQFTVETDNSSAAPSEPQQPGQPYVDRLIDEGAAHEEWDALDLNSGLAARTGLDFLSLTGRAYQSHSNTSGTLTEYGTQLVGRKETIDNGSFELQLDGLSTHDQQDERHEGGRIVLRQNQWVISNQWQIDNVAGQIRSQTPRSISASYRFHLPSTLLQGLGATLYNGKTALTINLGEIGGLSGTAAREFKVTQGSLQGASLTHRFNPQWFSSIQFWNTNDPQGAESHQSMAGMFQYQDSDQTRTHQLHFLTDSQSNAGLWYDAAVKQVLWSHNLGLYYLQPGLLWTDVAINNDQEGLYWRGSRRSFRWQWTLGSEISKDNLDNDPLLPGYLRTNSFTNGTWRFRRNTLLGAALYLNTRHTDSGTAQNDSHKYTLKNYVAQRFPIGMARFQASLSVQDNPDENGTQYGLLWDQAWALPFFHKSNTDIEYLSGNIDPDSLSMRLTLEKFITADVWLSGSAQYIHMLEQYSGQDDASNASMAFNWQINPSWKLSLSADLNKSSFETIDSVDIATENSAVLLSLNYAVSRPRRLPPIMGIDTDSIGHGEISGRIFLDENKNGRYDLNETVLDNIVVILDGRFQTETDPNGQYDYWPVAAGEHVIMIGIEDVPLPWGLEDDRPQKVSVPVRGRAVVDFALIKLNE